MRDLAFISCCPDDRMFAWTYRVMLSNFRKFGYSSLERVLVILPHDRLAVGWNPEFKQLEKDFPETKFFWHEDTEDFFGKFVRPYHYIPLFRPYLLEKHFREYPELAQKAIFYHDADIAFTQKLDFSPFLQDDTCYLSDTRSYIAASYWDSKIKDVLPERIEAYKKIDPLDICARTCGISRKICEENEASSGGAQYLLKGIDADYWKDVRQGCMSIRGALFYDFPGSVNNMFFASEDKGFQSWCCDMWSVLWNLWKRGYKTVCPKELDFAWATDRINKWGETYIYHDAGASPVPFNDERGKPHILFFKRGRDGSEYANNLCTPFDHELGYISPDYCSYKYVEEIQDAKKTFTNA